LLRGGEDLPARLSLQRDHGRQIFQHSRVVGASEGATKSVAIDTIKVPTLVRLLIELLQ